MPEIIVLALTVLLNLLLGLVVYLKNPKGLTNRYFLFLAITLVVWSVTNHISVHPFLLSQIWWVRLVLSLGALLNLSVFLTFLVFPSIVLGIRLRSIVRSVVGFTVLVVSLTLTPAVFKELRYVDGSAQPVPNPGIVLFLIHTIVLLGGSVYIIIRKFRASHGTERDQLRFVLFGIAGTFSGILVANVLLVIVFNITALVPFGPFFTLIFSSSLAYAIIKHRLFDIKSAVARGLAYLLSLASIGLVYGVLAFVISASFFRGGEVGSFQRTLYVAFALLTALLFQRTKAFFDKVTNRIFYRDGYDPQLFIDHLNKIFVSTINIETLLDKTNQAIVSDIKAEYSSFLIDKTTYSAVRWIGDVKPEIDQPTLAGIYGLLHASSSKVIVSEYLEEDPNLRAVLLDNNIAVVVQLVPTVQSMSPSIGLLVLGPKKSGNLYSEKDANILAIVANELVITVENALRFEEIEKFNITLQQKVEEATRQLRRTNEKLKALDETKDEFISMASHQLRTPLTSVKGYVSMVVEGDAGKITGKQKALLDQAFLSSQRMVYLIADLLNVSRLRTGKFVIDRQPTQLADVIEGELHQLTETAKARGITLVYHKPKAFPVLMIDETKTRQVVMNFADNAVYYTRTNGTINIHLEDKGTNIEFTVKDDGIGVPKEDQHHLFTKFYRANNARKARPDGTGLGLFMAKKVIVAQGGAILFHSEEGKGSTFGFTFPKDRLLDPRQGPKEAE